MLILIGTKFNRWTLLDKDFTCKCDCGTIRKVPKYDLLSSKSKSCGCLRSETSKERAIKRNTKHGKFHTPIYAVWDSMLSRCTNPNNKQYKHYGGRGITVCKRWFKFENFYKDMGDPPSKLTLDRINNNKGYSPTNCRWATMTTQAKNKRNSIYINYNGCTKHITDWAKDLNLSLSMLYQRYYKNWPIERMLTP